MITVFCYHSISFDEKDIYAVDPITFDYQIRLLKTRYEFIDIKRFQEMSKLGELPSRNYALMTFDDGFEDFLLNAYPILSKHQVSVTMFLPVDLLGKELFGKKVMTHGQLELLSRDALITFGSHALHHERLEELDSAALHRSINESRSKLFDLKISSIDAFAYPFGSHTSEVDKVALEAYKLVFGTDGHIIHKFGLVYPRLIMSKNVTYPKLLLHSLPAFANFWQQRRAAARV